MRIEDIQAIDVHGHYGNYINAKFQLENEFMTGNEQEVIRRARIANTKITVVSPLEALYPSYAGHVTVGNRQAEEAADQHDELLQWVVIHPMRPETFEQADVMLRRASCAGIKIHPELHNYPIKQYGEAIFRFAAERNAVVLTHSGEPNSLPEDFVPYADRYPEMKLILAHLGFGWDEDYSHQVRAIQQSRNGNLYTDTSSARSIVPNLIEWAVREVGASRILFGTDTPLYQTAMQRARIDHADLSDDEKRLILWDNAALLLQLDER